MTTNNTPVKPKFVITKKLSILIMIVAIIGGVGGALLLGALMEDTARSIFGLQPWNIGFLIIGGIVVLLLAGVGTGAMVVGFWIENPVIKIVTILFSIPIPICIEVADFIIRFIHVISDVQTFYGI